MLSYLVEVVDAEVENSIGDDRFRRVCVLREKRAKDAGLSCERPQQLIGAETKRTDFALAA